MSLSTHRPRRSCLYMPGANPRAIEKAKGLAADSLIFDLEDAVAPESKDEARKIVCEAIKAGGYGTREIVVRINGLDTEWGLDDIQAVMDAGPDAILAPKVAESADIYRLENAMSQAGAPDDMGLWVMIETPKAILNIQQIAEAAERTRLTAFVMGTNDLGKDLRVISDPPARTAFQTALSLSVTAARAYNLLAIDGVFNRIKNDEGLISECEQGRLLGFEGKTLIHPAQLDAANRIFAPSADDIEHANDVIDAFADPHNAGKGVLKVNGKMTELLHLEEAKRAVQMAEAIKVLENSL